jgi:hypothetical protein
MAENGRHAVTIERTDDEAGAFGDGLVVGGNGMRRVVAGVVDDDFRARRIGMCRFDVVGEEAIPDGRPRARQWAGEGQQQRDLGRHLVAFAHALVARDRAHGLVEHGGGTRHATELTLSLDHPGAHRVVGLQRATEFGQRLRAHAGEEGKDFPAVLFAIEAAQLSVELNARLRGAPGIVRRGLRAGTQFGQPLVDLRRHA